MVQITTGCVCKPIIEEFPNGSNPALQKAETAIKILRKVPRPKPYVGMK